MSFTHFKSITPEMAASISKETRIFSQCKSLERALEGGNVLVDTMFKIVIVGTIDGLFIITIPDGWPFDCPTVFSMSPGMPWDSLSCAHIDLIDSKGDALDKECLIAVGDEVLYLGLDGQHWESSEILDFSDEWLPAMDLRALMSLSRDR